MTGYPGKTAKPGFQDILLPCMGARPLRFNGALLVEGCSKVANRHQAPAGHPHCCVKVYERTGGFVAQILLALEPEGQPLSFLKTHTEPLALRHWIEHFDPAHGVDVSDINARIQAAPAPSQQDLSQAAESIRKRLKGVRDAYHHAARSALGRPDPNGGCAV